MLVPRVNETAFRESWAQKAGPHGTRTTHTGFCATSFCSAFWRNSRPNGFHRLRHIVRVSRAPQVLIEQTRVNNQRGPKSW